MCWVRCSPNEWWRANSFLYSATKASYDAHERFSSGHTKRGEKKGDVCVCVSECWPDPLRRRFLRDSLGELDDLFGVGCLERLLAQLSRLAVKLVTALLYTTGERRRMREEGWAEMREGERMWRESGNKKNASHAPPRCEEVRHSGAPGCAASHQSACILAHRSSAPTPVRPICC